MTLTPIETMATVLSTFILLKIILVFIHPGGWMKTTQKIMRHTKIVTTIYLIIIAVVGYYLLLSVNIVQIMGTSLLVVMLIALQFIPYMDDLIKISNKKFKTPFDIIKQMWLPILFWIAISLWTLYSIFA